MFRPHRLGICLLLAITASAAGAQSLRPPADVRGGAREDVFPAQGVDAAGMMLRIDRLENQVRGLTGQLEQMQFANRRLEEQLKKFQQDVEFRFQENSGRGAAPGRQPPAPAAPGRRTDATPGVSPAALGGNESTPLSTAPANRLGRRGDAFDPDADPTAPGAPRQLGAVSSPSTPLGPSARGPAPALTNGPIDDGDPVDPNAPIDLMRRAPIAPAAPPPVSPGGYGAGQVAPRQDAPGQMAAIPPQATPREEFDRAVAALRGGQFEAAETGFRDFLKKYPKNSLVADATYQLGDSYFRRQRSREAAEQFLKVSTDYSKSYRAPEALVKLGLSLEKLGAKEQACAAYGEVGRKYPSANASVRASADRESKRAQC